jgi:hypothetical protein
MFSKGNKICEYQSSPALAGVWAGFSRWPTLAGVQAGFSRFGLFRENWTGLLFATQTGFSRIGHFCASRSFLGVEIGHKNPQIRKN